MKVLRKILIVIFVAVILSGCRNKPDDVEIVSTQIVESVQTKTDSIVSTTPFETQAPPATVTATATATPEPTATEMPAGVYSEVYTFDNFMEREIRFEELPFIVGMREKVDTKNVLIR